MKNPSIRCLLPVLGLGLLIVPISSRADDAKVEKGGKKEFHTMGNHEHPGKGGFRGEMEPATFLGVEASRVSATLSEQLGLPPGFGLVINNVVPDSPAVGALKPHDIITKLNDQQLIAVTQLSVLVRSFKEGDLITLSYIRGAKPATVQVKLTTRDLPKLSVTDDFGGPRMFHTEDVDHVLGVLGGGAPGGPPPGAGEHRVFKFGRQSTMMAPGNSTLVFSDDSGSLELNAEQGKRTLTAKSPKGAVIFSGPIETPEQRAALPEEMRVRLEKLEEGEDLRFRTGPEFVPGDVHFFTPRAQQVHTQLPPIEGGRPGEGQVL